MELIIILVEVIELEDDFLFDNSHHVGMSTRDSLPLLSLHVYVD